MKCLDTTESSYNGEITKRNQEDKPMRTRRKFANEKELKSQIATGFGLLTLQKQQFYILDFKVAGNSLQYFSRLRV